MEPKLLDFAALSSLNCIKLDHTIMTYQVSIAKFSRFFLFFLSYAFVCLQSPGKLLAMYSDGDESASQQVIRYQLQVEYLGKVTTQVTPENPEPTAMPLDVKARFSFSQQPIELNQVIRHYQQAEAEIKLGEVQTTSELSSTNKQISARLIDKRFSKPVQLNSIGGLLKQSELELITVPADPLSFNDLVSYRAFKEGEKWKPSDQAVRALLAVETIIENDLSILLKESRDGTAKLYLAGDVKAEIDGCMSKYHLVGLALLNEADNSITGLRLTIDESRSASQLAPAFDGQIKVDVRKLTADEADRIETNTVKATVSNKATRLLWSTESEFELVYDPRWKIILSDRDAVIMRYADQGNLLAQCSLLQLPKRPVDRPVPIDEFRKEIEKILVESPARLVSANTVTTLGGLTAHKIVVSGLQDDVAIDWIYYHVSNHDGRRVAMIFTVEHEVAKTFGNADQRLVEAVRFVPVKTTAVPSGTSNK
jgi:hypothetical protein